jgi:hypothetical protein
MTETRRTVAVRAKNTVALPSSFDEAIRGAATELVERGARAREKLTIWHNPTSKTVTLNLVEGESVTVAPA